jgi:hypothetical protein
LVFEYRQINRSGEFQFKYPRQKLKVKNGKHWIKAKWVDNPCFPDIFKMTLEVQILRDILIGSYSRIIIPIPNLP